jgi:hypothetical protein
MKPKNFPTRPGIYLVDGKGSMFIELEADGKVHQLRFTTFERDGVLDDEGWHNDWPLSFYGPLARVPNQPRDEYVNVKDLIAGQKEP